MLATKAYFSQLHPREVGRAIVRRPWRSATLAALCIYALSVFIPWQPYITKDELDSSWFLLLHWARLHRLNFGTDLVFTYGPLGFIHQGYHPDTFWLVVLGWTFYTAALFAALVTLSKRVTRWPWAGAIWMAVVIAVAGAAIQGIQDTRAFMLCWAFLLVHFYVDRRELSPLKIALVIAMAMWSLAKFSLSMMALTTLAITTIDQLLRRERPWLLLIYLGAIGVFWIAAGQSIASFPAYIRNSLHISSTYAQGEATFTDTDGRDITLFLLLAAGLHALVLVAHWKELRACVLPQIALAGSLFLLFKVGYVRHDGHEMLATVGIACFTLLYGAAIWPKLEHWIPRAVLGVLVICSFWFTWYSEARWAKKGLASHAWQTIGEFPNRTGLALGWMVGKSPGQQSYETTLADFRVRRRVPQTHGNVDAYSWTQRSILANNLPYRPRPVAQSYLAFSPKLAEFNAEFLRSPQAPDSILFDIQSIDTHLASLEDALSWPELLTRYDVRDASGSLLLLERAHTPRQYSLKPLGTAEASMHEWVNVPPSTDPIWAKIDVESTATGKLVQAIYKPRALFLQVQTRGGQTTQFRFMPEVGKGGFLLSPIINDRTAFGLLNSTAWNDLLGDAVITQCQILADTPTGISTQYNAKYRIEFYGLQFPHIDLSAVPGIADYLDFHQFLKSLRTIRLEKGIQMVKTADGDQILLVPGNTQLLTPTRSNARTLVLSFGIFDTTGNGLEKAAPVEFRAYGVTQDAKNQLQANLIWAKNLDPAKHPDDRLMQFRAIQFDGPTPPGIMLETATGSGSNDHLAYWSGVSFR